MNKQYVKILNGEIVKPQNPYNVIIDGEKCGLFFDFENLTEDQINILKSDCFKEHVYDYEANHSYIEETYTQIISHIVKEIPNPEQFFNSRKAVEDLFPMFENEMLDFGGDVALVINMIQFGGAFKSIIKKIEYMYQTSKISNAGYEYFLFVFNEQNIDLLSYLTLE